MELFFENKQSGHGGILLMRSKTEEIGRLIYTLSPEQNLITIDHVFIHSRFEGQGLGKKLVEKSVEIARENHWNMKAYCSFAHVVLKRKKDVQDIFKP